MWFCSSHPVRQGDLLRRILCVHGRRKERARRKRPCFSVYFSVGAFHMSPLTCSPMGQSQRRCYVTAERAVPLWLMRTTRRVMKKLMAAACYQTRLFCFLVKKSPDCFSLDKIDSHCRLCLRRSKSLRPSWQVIKRSKNITKETGKTVFWPHILLMKGRFNLGDPISISKVRMTRATLT